MQSHLNSEHIQKIRLWKFNFLIAVLCLVVLSACNADCDQFEDKIGDALFSESSITKEEFLNLRNQALNDSAIIENCWPELWNGGHFDDQAFLDLIKSNKRYKMISRLSGGNPLADIDKALFEDKINSKDESGIKPKLYLERSGSMVFYDKDLGKGQFKANLVKILNEFTLAAPEESLIYIVNDAVYDFNMSFAEFIRLPDVFAASRTYGNANYTDFDKIFRTLTDKTEDHELSIFVSDFIYSTAPNGSKNPERIVLEVKGLMTNVFNKVSNDYSFLIVKFNGDYHGKYYDYQDAPHDYSGLRPYYISFFAKTELMNEFLSNRTYDKITDFGSYLEFENFYLFSSTTSGNQPNYTILKQDPDNKGRFRQSPDEMKLRKATVTQIEDVTPDKLSGDFVFSIAVDLSGYLIDPGYILDIRNYALSLDGYELVAITPTDSYQGYTHKIVLSNKGEHIETGKLSISLINSFPNWIRESSTLNDQNPDMAGFENTTFVFEGMMEGIYEAYHKDLESPKYFEIMVQLDK